MTQYTVAGFPGTERIDPTYKQRTAALKKLNGARQKVRRQWLGKGYTVTQAALLLGQSAVSFNWVALTKEQIETIRRAM